MRLQAASVEKDFWICWTLRELFALPEIGLHLNVITGQDILGRTYQVQYAMDPQATNWQTLGTATTNSSGTFQFIDSNAAPQRFYRTQYP